MRLIDADELYDHIGRDKLDTRELIMKMIDEAPTVHSFAETIKYKQTVEFLKNDIKRAKDYDELLVFVHKHTAENALYLLEQFGKCEGG